MALVLAALLVLALPRRVRAMQNPLLQCFAGMACFAALVLLVLAICVPAHGHLAFELTLPGLEASIFAVSCIVLDALTRPRTTRIAQARAIIRTRV